MSPLTRKSIEKRSRTARRGGRLARSSSLVHRLPKALVLAFAVTLASQPMAEAASVQHDVNLDSGNQCLRIISQVNAGPHSNGEAVAESWSRKKWLGFWDCGTGKDKNPGEILSRWEYWYNDYPLNSGGWGLCQNSGPNWWTNSEVGSQIRTSGQWIYSPCGDGYYATNAGAGIWYPTDGYPGGWYAPYYVWSGHMEFSGGSK